MKTQEVKKMKKLKVSLAALVVVSLLSLSACVGTGAATPDTSGPLPAQYQPQIQPAPEIDWSLYPIIVDGVGVAADLHTAQGEDFPTHLPLLPVAAILGSEVSWNPNSQEFTLDGLKGTVTFAVGSTNFEVAGETTVSLPHPSTLIDGEVYVPIQFFRDVFGMGEALWMSGHVYIETYAFDDMH